jgi:hypothetical protein
MARVAIAWVWAAEEVWVAAVGAVVEEVWAAAAAWVWVAVVWAVARIDHKELERRIK